MPSRLSIQSSTALQLRSAWTQIFQKSDAQAMIFSTASAQVWCLIWLQMRQHFKKSFVVFENGLYLRSRFKKGSNFNLRSGGRVARQRSAKPRTAVRIRSRPQFQAFFCIVRKKAFLFVFPAFSYYCLAVSSTFPIQKIQPLCSTGVIF